MVPDWLGDLDIAHRGLHLPGSIREENSRAAVRAAVDKGFAVEVDVQNTADDIAVVFHDYTLDRLTEREGPIHDFGYAQLRDVTLGETDEGIPLLTDMLDIIDRRVPLYVEIKSSDAVDIQKLCASVVRACEGYHDMVAVMSFDCRVVEWFSRYLPGMPRGQVLGREALLSMHKRLKMQYSIGRTKPHFLACDINLLPNSLCTKWRAKGGKLLTWTVRDADMENIGRVHADALIFEEPAVTGGISDIF